MNQFQQDKQRAGEPGEQFFMVHAEQITGLKIRSCEPLPQIAHNEGDYILHLMDGRSLVIEIKTEASTHYSRTGNLPVQFYNDTHTQRGWISDIQDPTKRKVDLLCYVVFQDKQCLEPYAAICMAVKPFIQIFGCPESGGCEACLHRCPEPDTPGGLETAFPGFFYCPKDNPCALLVNVQRTILPQIQARYTSFADLEKNILKITTNFPESVPIQSGGDW